MTLVAGVDIGSTTAKSVIMEDGALVGQSLAPVGVRIVEDAERSLDAALGMAGRRRADLDFVVGTGYGRFKIKFGNAIVTEISCHAKGALHLFPKTRVVLDIGGQDTKAIRVGPDGEVEDFSMNDKCAAGTGRFLDVCAGALGYQVGEIGPLALKATRPTPISSTCTVFAESEVTSQLARGRTAPDILAGTHLSIANRSLSLLQRVGIEPELTFTGGVSRNEGMRKALVDRIGLPINVSPLSQYIGAIGAALHGHERVQGVQA